MPSLNLNETRISNMALHHIGVSKRIAEFSENSLEANTCRLFYEINFQQCLRDFPWPFATKFHALALIATDPTTEWGYSYRYPPDCVEARRILSGVRNDHPKSRVPYRIGIDDEGQLIYTDMASAVLECTMMVTPNFFPPDFSKALSLRLASDIAATLQKGDQAKLGAAALQRYYLEVDRAKANAANEEAAEEAPDSEFISER